MDSDALKLIKENYLEFSKYTMQYRTYPSVFDGCKIAQRRVLWSAYDKAPSSKMIKLSSMSGLVMQVHPHAEATDVIINMAGKYKTVFPLFDTHGNYGDNFGNPASAPRYLECKLNDIARNIYFSLIDEAPFENFEVENEPLYLPTLFPLAFLQGCFSVGQGTPNPLIPDLQFDDLRNYIVNFIKTGETKVTKSNFVKLVDYDKIRDDNDKEDSVCRLLNTGKGSIYYQPKVELKDNIITISNLYILADFKSLVDRFKDDIQSDKIDIRDESTDERVWVIEKVKNKVFDMDECAKIVKQKFTYKENYAMYFHDENGCVKPYSLGEVISICYNRYRDAYISKINKEIQELEHKDVILRCLSAMSEKKYIDIVTNPHHSSVKDKAEAIYSNFEDSYKERFSKDIVEECLYKPIHMFKPDQKAIDYNKINICKSKQKINNIDSVIIEEIKKL